MSRTTEKRLATEAGRAAKRASRRDRGGAHGDHETDTTADRTTVDRSEAHRTHSLQSVPRRDNFIYENTYRMEPHAKFDSELVEKLISPLLSHALETVEYEPIKCKLLSQELAAKMTDKVKELHWRRYKYVALVSIMSIKEKPSMNVGSRCLWNLTTDSYATVRYHNNSVCAVAILYGLYFE